VGACVAVGEARLPASRVAGIREEVTRGSEFIVMPARGLTLIEVGYPDVAELAARAIQTRVRRDAFEARPHGEGSFDKDDPID